MAKKKFSIDEAKRLDMVNYLESIGCCPQKISGHDYWFFSPLREEYTPSFKINRKLNLWYDHGMGKGGTLIDFGLLFYGCTITEFLQKLGANQGANLSFQPPSSPSEKVLKSDGKKLQINSVGHLVSPRFMAYLNERKIDLNLAKKWVTEVCFELHGKKFRALGFQNNSGGYELRSEHFKGSSSPKDVTLIGSKTENISVFEGFFSFLSYLCLCADQRFRRSGLLTESQSSFLILNSLSFFERSRPIMERYDRVHLYLDRDTAGLRATKEALGWTTRYSDRSALYNGHKDLNDFLIFQHTLYHRQHLGRRKHF